MKVSGKNPVVLDRDRLWELILDIAEESATGGGFEEVEECVLDFMEMSFFAGREEVLRAGEARAAMLDAMARWRDSADRSEDALGKMVGEFVAKAFEEEARTLKKVRAVKDVQLPVLDEDPREDDIKTH